MSKVKHEYNGIKGVRAIAAAYDISAACIIQRIKAGMSMEEALTKGKQLTVNPNGKVKHVYKGFAGVPAIAKAFGFSKSSIYKRLGQGMSIDEAVQTPHRSGNKYISVYQYNGVSGLKNIAKATGIAASTLKGRVARGMSIEEAVKAGDCRKQANVADVEWNGHKGFTAISRAAGINRETLRYRMRQGLTVEQAINWEKGCHTQQFERNGNGKKTTNPDLLNNSWRLALGMRASA